MNILRCLALGTLCWIVAGFAASPALAQHGAVVTYPNGPGMPPPLPPVPLPPLPPAPADQGTLSVETATGNSGETVRLSVHVNDCVTDFIHFDLLWDNPELLTFVSWSPGAAMMAYAADTDECDVFIFPAADNVIMSDSEFYATPFDSDVYGTELLVLEFATPLSTSGLAQMLLIDMWGQFSLGSVEVLPTTPIRRGDLNGDQSVSLADAILLLSYLSGSVEVACPRAADVDQDDNVSIADTVQLLNTLFGSKPPLPRECTPSPQDGPLPCTASGC